MGRRNKNSNHTDGAMKKYEKSEDICTHTGDEYEKYLGAVIPPIFQNSLFVQEKGKPYGSNPFIYTRLSNPTIEVAETKIASLEKGDACRCFSSGMAAVSSGIMYYLEKDSHVVAVKNVYGPTRMFLEEYLTRWGISVSFVVGDSIKDFEKAIQPNTKLIYLESPSTFIYSLQDLEGVSALAKSNGIHTMIDNTYATPLYQNPLLMGIEMVMHTASKYLGGHSDIVAGSLVGSQIDMDNIMNRERSLFGGNMDPHQAWLLTRGLRTLPIRLKQHGESAIKIAQFLENHSKIKRVLYPGLKSHPQQKLIHKQMGGFCGLMSILPKGTDQEITNFVDKLSLFQTGCSWGGFESLVIPISVGMEQETAKHLNLPTGLVRLHIGLENTESLMIDLDQALKVIP
jgi:cystathionine beta-lyase/cystathionine gamma-synthase